MATAKGHMDKHRKNHRSTKPEPKPTNNDDPDTDAFPPQASQANALFACFALANDQGHIVYTDLTGAFPITSHAGNKYLLVLYDYDSSQ
jgi:hypothetical protein